MNWVLAIVVWGCLGFYCPLVFGQVATERLIDRLIPVNLRALYPGPCQEFDQYVPVYRDEFNGDSLDHWFWQPNLLGHHHSPSGTDTDEYNSEDQLHFDPSNNGTLTIRIENNPIDGFAVPWDSAHVYYQNLGYNYRTWPFRSGAITTNWEFPQGRFIFRTQIPSGRFMWPAFWLYGSCGSEIDGFEFQHDNSDIAHDKKPSFSIHKSVGGCSGPSRGETRTHNVGQSLAANFHTYSFDWNDFVIRFAIDGSVKETYFRYYKRIRFVPYLNQWIGVEGCSSIEPNSDYYEDPYFPLVMMYVIANAAVLENATAGAFPRDMKIDYLSISDMIDCQENRLISTPFDMIGYDSQSDIGDRTITSGSITVDPAYQLLIKQPSLIAPWLPGDFLIMTAAQEIVVRPGFDVEMGGNLIAQIKPCAPNSKNDSLDWELAIPRSTPNSFYSFEDSLVPSDVMEQMGTSGEGNMQIFPNPAYSSFQILGTEIGDVVSILDLSGKVIETGLVINEVFQSISIENLQDGIYIVQIRRRSKADTYLKLIKL